MNEYIVMDVCGKIYDHHHDGRKMVMVMETNEKKKGIIFEIGLVGLVTVNLL
jgi:hypothetical protein